MKKNIHYLFPVLLVLLALLCFACSDDYTELNKGNDELTLTASKTNLTLDIRTPDAEAIAFNWTSGTNQGTGAAIEYTFQMDIAGNSFQHGITEYIGKTTTRSLSYTHEELVALLTEDLALPYNQEATIEVRVVAEVMDGRVADQFAPVVTLKLTPYKPVSKKLYLIGDATPKGWSADEATEMNPVSGNAGGFVWTGEMKKGSFKFITTLGEFVPSYNKDGDQQALVLRESFDDPDEVFYLDEAGYYQITANIIDLTIDIEKLAGKPGPRYDMIYFVGSFTSWNHTAMIQDPMNNYLFHYNEVFTWNGGGEFKFGTAPGSWDDMYLASEADAPYTSTKVLYKGTNDYKWQLKESECGKAYKMVLDITDGKEQMLMKEFTPFGTMYLVGDATPYGWSYSDGPMTRSGDYLFTWTGQLNTGELKFACGERTNWEGPWFIPVKDGAAPTGESEQMFLIVKSDDDFYALYPDVNMGGLDNKWRITTAGTYTITLDQLHETVTIVKQ